ncbi:MAG: hypothetical protein IK020_05235 [Clostridiales bacterium]|nr:hypothetical protein [Clostridiales bacterium]
MKRRILSCFLAITMLVGAFSGVLLADGEQNGNPDPVVAGDSQTSVEELPEFLGALTEGEELVVTEEIHEGELRICTFTPEVSGRYGFLCADGLELSVTVKDEYGTEVVPQESDVTFRSVVQYLQLEAGIKYIFYIRESDEYSSAYSEYTYVRILINRSSRQLSLGETALFMRGNTDKRISFTPSQSGSYTFRVTSLTSNISSVNTVLYKDGTNDRLADGSSIPKGSFVFAELSAGVTYELCCNCYRDSSQYCAFLVSVGYGFPELNEGTNDVDFKSDYYNSTYYSFTPTETDIYIFESEGNYSTHAFTSGYPESGSETGIYSNFRLGARMEAGKTYTLRFYMSDYGEATIPVKIYRATRLNDGPNSLTVEANAYGYFAFTPSESGYYIACNDSSKVHAYCRDGSDSVRDLSYSYYLEKDKLYYFYCTNSTDSDQAFDLTIKKIDTELVVGGEGTTMTKLANDYAYAKFTPTQSGTYSFTPSESCATIRLYTSNPNDNIYVDYPSSATPLSVTLSAGETYILALSYKWMDNPPTTNKITVTKETHTVLKTGKNEVSYSQSGDTYYSYTPEKTGLYQIHYENDYYYSLYNVNFKEGADPVKSYSTSNEPFKVVYLTAGHDYTVTLNSNYSGAGIPFNFYIDKAPTLAIGTNQIYRSDFEFCAEFTPSESGLYGFTTADGDIYSRYFRYATSLDESPEFTFTGSEDVRYAYLEKGVTYMAYFSRFGSYDEPVPIVVTHDEPVLNMGTNNVVISGDPVQYDMDYDYNYFTFIAPSDGPYTFRTEQEGHAALRAYLLDVNTSIGSLHEEDEEGNFSFDCDLKAGKLYRLKVYQYNTTEDAEVSLIVEKTVIPEARLEGYSLILDGSIGVNLYMALDESITSSDSSVLWITFPDSDGNDGMRYWIKSNLNNTREVNGETYYVFTIPMAAKEMTAEFTAQIIDLDAGFEGKKYDISVRDYAEYILENAYYDDGYVKNKEYADAVPLVKAMLNYGTRAQLYFKYRTDADQLANSILSEEDRSLKYVNPGSIPHFDSSTVTLPEGVSFYGASLILESNTTLNFYFENTSGKTIKFATDSDPDGFYRVPRSVGNYLVVSVTGIPAHRLSNCFNVYVFVDGVRYTITYSPLHYCYNVLSRDITATRTQELKDLMTSFYLFTQQAKAYIDG